MRGLRASQVPLLALLAATAHAALSIPANVGAYPRSDGLLIEHTGGPENCSRPTRSGDTIAVHYKGTLLSTGEEFDESYKRGRPFSFTLGQGAVIKGWDQGLVGMCIGESKKLTIPPELAYGDYGTGPIPPKATLVFETRLEDIVGLAHETGISETPATSTSTVSSSQTVGGGITIATAPPSQDGDIDNPALNDDGPASTEPSTESDIITTILAPEQADCKLLGPFALLVQGALGALALLALVWKRWREVPKRPWKIFIFDVSKQVVGSFLTHAINLAMSMLGSIDMANAVTHAVSTGGATMQDSEGRTPNPCSYYLLNLAIDTTIGVPVLYLLLKILYALFSYTALARPPQSIKTGNYGHPPKATWYAKQLLIYCIGLVCMKIFVFFLFMALPWLPWVGDWALRWTKGNEALEITFALFLFPLAMNGIQYWVIDNFIMEKKKKSDDGYEQVAAADDTDEERQRMIGDEPDAEDIESIDGKTADALMRDAPLVAANPTPVPIHRENAYEAEGSDHSISSRGNRNATQ